MCAGFLAVERNRMIAVVQKLLLISAAGTWPSIVYPFRMAV
jgi:hypothetical protein